MRVRGTVRLDRKTKNLARRLKPGEIALIDHVDIDSTAARMLVDAKVAAVVNVAKSCSGRYPNLGPRVLLYAGITLIYCTDVDLFKGLKEGEQIELEDGSISRNGVEIAVGELLTDHRVDKLIEQSRKNLGNELEQFAENTLSYVTKEK